LPKFQRTNQNTTIDLRPIVRKGDKVTKGQILTEGYATEQGELALGKNLKVAYIPWKGYNYEDAIVLSERIVREDMFTSVHVVEQLLEVRETKRGVEEFTSDIPNVSEEATKDLDENGIIRIGAHINPGDIIVGKITPKGESDPSPEEKLLKAIFGDKAGDVKDASLKATPSLSGVVIGKSLYKKANKDRKQKLEDRETMAKLDAQLKVKAEALKNTLVEKLVVLLKNQVSAGVKDYLNTEVIVKGQEFTAERLQQLDFMSVMLENWTEDAHVNDLVSRCIVNYIAKHKEMDAQLKREKFNLTIDNELPNGIM
jgi:DNA-directed RNA polymerase subunit beta